jgi:hypothetical protein
MARFLEARAQAFLVGKYEPWRPLSPWGRIARWRLENRNGLRCYGKVNEFVHLVDLEALGNRIAGIAREIWRRIGGHGEYMTIRLLFSAQGLGNPFYAEAWIADDSKFEFFTKRSDRIDAVDEIERQVRLLLEDVYDVSQEILIYFEYFEVVKSLPN